ncbi:hypothetical protein [Chryseosolibacter indicus]|uniref:Uncharacterized protein n=1 Tax=Chryseosolibacter indicus TaxID=2782351 RepID=A0ABS5VW42_9BACT|nr:hypothetical protein [Chryseosolibacter indicus]MBT1705658.1 hypothetical protein [Chryseosolibacter indicus]
MKTIRTLIGVCLMAVMQVTNTFAQKIDEERMKRDIEVAENVLQTLIKQEVNQQRGFFGMDIKGSYLPGYGVTFKLPPDFAAPFVISIGEAETAFNWDRRDGYSYTVTTRDDGDDEDNQSDDESAYKLKNKTKEKKQLNADSVKSEYNQKLIKAAKDFIIDYGDFISQLGANEKIVVTNRGDHNRGWYLSNSKRTHLSVEGSKSDIQAFKQGKISREQALSKITVVNTESVNTKQPDLELLTSIINRLYSPDLSKTYFTENDIYYEVLKDYGVVYYMQVYSAYRNDRNRFSMPTVALNDVDQATRDKKITEVYPKFEQELKENILEYGRTIKSLKDDELVVFNVTLTKCKGCGIPSTLEVSVKSSVLKDFGAGKIEKGSALNKFSVKKGANQ